MRIMMSMVLNERQWWILGLLVSVSLHVGWLTATPTMPVAPMVSGGGAVPVTVSFAQAPAAKQPQAKPQTKPETTPPVETPEVDLVEQSTLKTPVVDKAVAKPVEEPQEPVEFITEPEEAEIAPVVEAPQVEALQDTAQEQLAELANSAAESDQPQNDQSLPVVTEPNFTAQPQPPVYPRLALKRRWQGEVVLKALVDRQGVTERVEVVSSSGFALLDEAAIAAVEKWKFAAAKESGLAVRAWVQVPVAFNINQ